MSEKEEFQSKVLKTVKRYLTNNGTCGHKREHWQEEENIDSICLPSMFKEDLGMDSLDMVELLLEIEDEYDVVLNMEEFREFKTLGNSIDYFYDTYGADFKNPKTTNKK
tara:strand:+ start:343 stop:669 length:327 start_codon:yes stop_codon:yes gene_type:complete